MKYKDVFDCNGLDNGIPLPKKRLKFEQSGHANHPNYDRAVREKIENILNNAVDEDNAIEKIKQFVNHTKNKLENDVLLGVVDVNNIIIDLQQ